MTEDELGRTSRSTRATAAATDVMPPAHANAAALFLLRAAAYFCRNMQPLAGERGPLRLRGLVASRRLLLQSLLYFCLSVLTHLQSFLARPGILMILLLKSYRQLRKLFLLTQAMSNLRRRFLYLYML